MTSLRALAERWEAEAELLRTYGADEAAAAAEKHARELREAVEAARDELLSPDEAAEFSGYSKRRLRELDAERRLENRGRKGAPLYRRADLPRKGSASSASGSGFDPDAEAMELLS